MSAGNIAARPSSLPAILRRRESATEAMIRQIDEKLARLGAARRERANALKRIRCDLARSISAEPVTPECHEHRKI